MCLQFTSPYNPLTYTPPTYTPSLTTLLTYNLQEQLATTEKERDSANAKAKIASLASAVKAKAAVDKYKANPTGAGAADDSKACTMQ